MSENYEDGDPLDDPIGQSVGRKPRAKRERMIGPFYQVSESWADRAAEATGMYLILALRLYLCWRKRLPGADTVAVTTAALSGPGYSQRGKLRVVNRLTEAGLVEVVERAPRRAVRVRVVDPQLRL